MYWKQIVDVRHYEGHFYVPWSWRNGKPLAFPRFDLAPVCVEAFSENGNFIWAPSNVSHYLWLAAAAEFVACDAERNDEFKKRARGKKTQLDLVEDKDRVIHDMTLISSKSQQPKS